MVPNSGAESDTEMYSSPVFFEIRFQPAPTSKPILARHDSVVGLALLRLAAVGDKGDRRRDVQGGQRAFQVAVLLLV